jgi:ferredoxin
MVCGSVEFGADMRAALVASGVPSTSVHQEAFYSPPPAHRPRHDPVAPGPFAVRFAEAGAAATWTADTGTLLDVAEADGLTPPVDCRTGACNVCATGLMRGTTAYTTPPMVPPPEGTVLICCAVPTSDVTLAL